MTGTVTVRVALAIRQHGGRLGGCCCSMTSLFSSVSNIARAEKLD